MDSWVRFPDAALGDYAFHGKFYMKKIVKVTEIEGEGLEALMGEKVILMCMNYNYVGTLEGVNEKFVMLGEDAAICYETGAWTDKSWKDAQKIGHQFYVMIDKIESFGLGK